MIGSIVVPAFVYDYLDTLRDERLNKGLSISVLSKATGVAVYAINDYEYGKKPAKKNYNKLAAFFQWKEWLF